MFFKSLHSPLVGTVGVLAALGLLAIPLRHLTSATPAHPLPAAPSRPTAADTTPALLRLKLLTPARAIRVTTETGAILLDLTDVAAGESECDSALPIHHDALELLLHADLGDSPADTAVFLTVMPDGREAQTNYLLGRGSLIQPLRFNWPPL